MRFSIREYSAEEDLAHLQSCGCRWRRQALHPKPTRAGASAAGRLSAREAAQLLLCPLVCVLASPTGAASGAAERSHLAD